MVSSIFKPSLISSVLLLVFLSFARSSYSGKSVKVEVICSKSKNPPFCLRLLKSKEGADLLSLGQYTIGIAHVHSSNTLNLIHSLIKHTSDPKLKKHYLSCSEHYDDALSDLEMAKKYLSTGDYNGVNISASAVFTDVDDCDSEKIADPSSLPKNNKDLEDISVIISVIANFLAQN